MEFPVTVDASALPILKRMLARKPEATFVRIGLKGGGCSGFEYVIRADHDGTPYDVEAEVDGLRIVCDTRSAKYLSGSTLRGTSNLIQGCLEFENPHASRTCGCGTSFTPKGL